MPESIEAAMAPQAAAFVQAFSGRGSPVDGAKRDHSPASLAVVDGILEDFHRQGAALPEDLHFIASAYLFEVARCAYGGRYLRGPASDPFVLVTSEPECGIGLHAMSKVRGRAVTGPEDSIAFFKGIAPLLARKESAAPM